jgi:hypothetical protein
MAQQTALSWYIEQHKILSSKTNDMPISELLAKIKDIEIQAKEMEKEQRKNDITDYNIKVTEFLLNPSFNLEHSNHGIACEKLADIRNEFIKNQ